MSNVRSSRGLTEELLKAGVAPESAAAGVTATVEGKAPAATVAGAIPPRPIAIVGVHGISPIQQYGFQDQLATGLLGYLNALEQAGASRRTWIATPYWPRETNDEKSPVLKPSALRLHCDDEPDPENPRGRVYDVYEGYWSPYSKGKTNIAKLLAWLLNCTFLATSSTAKIPASWGKLGWDLSYVFGALFMVVVFLALGFTAGTFAWGQFLALFGDAPSPRPLLDFAAFFAVILQPLTELKKLPSVGWFQLAVDVVLSYLVCQLYIVTRTRIDTRARTKELRRDGTVGGRFEQQTIDAENFHSVMAAVFAGVVVLLLALDVLILQHYHPDAFWAIMWHGVWLVAAIGFFQKARSIADFVVEDVLGDVQVYCTHDCNSAFYRIREQIIEAVTNAILGALKAVDRTGTGSPLYEKIHVVGHSLGTTVALDALIRVRQFVEEESVERSEWGRIRSFTTFGTALEKTRFLLDVRNPTVSAAQQQWKNDTYGRFFTLDRSALGGPDNGRGIFWSNHWYFNDIVANKIVSYKSDVHPGPSFAWTGAKTDHPICEDNQIANGRPIWNFVHSDYIGDPLFWKNAGPVITS
jgi:hypothetical protein